MTSPPFVWYCKRYAVCFSMTVQVIFHFSRLLWHCSLSSMIGEIILCRKTLSSPVSVNFWCLIVVLIESSFLILLAKLSHNQDNSVFYKVSEWVVFLIIYRRPIFFHLLFIYRDVNLRCRLSICFSFFFFLVIDSQAQFLRYILLTFL